MTADGSISCADEPDKQEIVIGQLLYCEVVAALINLACDGTLVIKMFTMFEHHTIGILFLLCCLFEEVEIIKPGMVLFICLESDGGSLLALPPPLFLSHL